ncbi:alcohol dehydrogenase catalytic domain-containing protein [Microbispora triticiradicis]|uniref:alcohol dehydrogenase catalytic domain-containing protein n=1 Tax=Microbispora triticiradicis TaxID=2200763 RepID=UPI001AD6412B|nr:alcohol dehydrogenase catalytic domain-containing protein [Microbispora triticiradicis]MBO4273994.1 alcohol dehydrogenase catalytic domain-containing protein [Microbispora triticiradicis]
MRAARLHKVGDIRLSDEPPPVPGPGESLVRVTAVGLCGSDLHWYAEGGIGDAVLDTPLVVGHEIAGVIEGGPRDGTRVAVDPAIPCGRCAVCATGYGNLCPDVRFAGHGTLDGGLRERIAWPDDLLHPLPAALSDGDGAMLEPLGVAIHAVDLGHVPLGAPVAVVGCGPIGLLVIRLARLAGACAVVAVDPLPHRRAAALRYGAGLALSPEEAAEPGVWREVDGSAGLGVRVAFEVAGDDEAVRLAMTAVRPGGRVVLAGIPDEDRTCFPASLARRKGLTIALVRRMNLTYPRAIRLAADRLVDVSSLITERFPLTATAEAFTAAVSRRGLKVLVEPGRR